jgi:hypothetical protein
MPSLAGDSKTFPTSGKAGAQPFKKYSQGVYPTMLSGPRAGAPVRCRAFTIVNLGSANIMVGPNGSAGFQLGPNLATTLEIVAPGEVAIDDLGVSQTVSINYGGECEQDSG